MRAIVFCVLAGLATPALAARKEDPKLVAARDAAIAMATPALCPGLRVDDEALTAYLARAAVAERDVTGLYRTPTHAAVSAFEQAARTDRDETCATTKDRLGVDGLGLLTSESDD